MREEREAVSSERARARLLELGRAGLGGFVRDEGGGTLVREVPERRLDELVKGEAMPWRRAMEIVRDLAHALEACESRGLFPGPLTPSQIGIDERATFMAEHLVSSLLGRTLPASGALPSHASTPSARWTPPEQADGAPWDNAANRYVLGLVAYRIIGGALPFGGAGIRADLKERGAEGAAPFPDAIASALEPGVQSFVLAMLAPKKSARPSDARAIAQRAGELLSGKRARSRSRAGTKAPASAPSKAFARRRSPRWWAVLPIATGILLASGLLYASKDEPEPQGKPTMKAWKLEGSQASECGSCHARETAEWQRSVMAHAAKSPLYGALESVVEEQIGRSDDCPEGAGVLRKAGGGACFDRNTGLKLTASGGEHWCVNCHAPAENVSPTMPAWNARGRSPSQRPIKDLLGKAGLEGIGCVACHQVSAAHSHSGTEGNPSWTSTATGRTFSMRPDDSAISNSAYRFDTSLLAGDFVSHANVPSDVRSHMKSSALCGACHDVRLFGTDVIGQRDRGEHFKRLRNAYSEWATWADSERRLGRTPATCQGCHMSRFPGVCVPGANNEDDGGCPNGTHFEAHAPGDALPGPSGGATHWFTSVDIPMTPDFPDLFASDTAIDAFGMPMGLEARRGMLLRHTFRFQLEGKRAGRGIEIPITIENIGGGHRVPAGFSQEREIWVELTVEDARGALVYSVGRIASEDEDLHDKRFVRVNTDGIERDFLGRPLGMFGADIADGVDVPRWSPSPAKGGTNFRGKGLINFQNGFLRCVRCIGFIDGEGKCQAADTEQAKTRAGRFADGAYDPDTGECTSNLANGEELFETYFPVGALDADRGIAKAPDAIIDTRSAPPGVPILYTYQLDPGAQHPGPFTVKARLRFRPFPPFLVKAFADYEANMASLGKRPSGPQVTRAMLARLKIVDLAHAETTIP